MNMEFQAILDELREALTAWLLLPDALQDDHGPEYRRWIEAYDKAWWHAAEEPDRLIMRAVIQDVQQRAWSTQE